MEWATSTIHSRWLFLLALNVVLILVGGLIEIYAAIVVVVVMNASKDTGFLATFADGWLLFSVNCGTVTPDLASDGIIARLATQKVARELQGLLKA